MKNIVLIGLPGSGKTTIGQTLSQKLNLDFLDTDNLIETKTGLKINDIFESQGEAFFRKLESEICTDVSKMRDKVISTGGGIILKEENIKALKQNGIIIFISRTPENILLSLEISERPLLKDDKNKIFRLDTERNGLYKKYCDFEIDNNISLEHTVFVFENMINTNSF